MADTLGTDELDAIRIGGAGWCSEEMFDAVFDHYETKLRALRESHDALVTAGKAVLPFMESLAQHRRPGAWQAWGEATDALRAALAKAEALRHVCDCGADSDAHTKECAYSRRLDAEEALHG